MSQENVDRFVQSIEAFRHDTGRASAHGPRDRVEAPACRAAGDVRRTRSRDGLVHGPLRALPDRGD